MEITCYRDPEIKRESRSLSANIYNLAVTLLARCPTKHLFVPIRSMQYMAIIDHEEFVFIDGERKCWVDLSWQNFKSHERESLDQPVAYQAVYYREGLSDIMNQLHSEFPNVLQVLAKKERLDGPARIINFPQKQSKS